MGHHQKSSYFCGLWNRTTKFLFIFQCVFIMNSLLSQAASFDGNYQTNCFLTNNNEDAFVSRIEIVQNQFTRIWKAFEDEKCIKPYLNYIEHYKYSLNGLDWDGTVVEVGYQPLTAEVASALNFINWCGFSDWKMNGYKVVTGKTCGEYEVPEVGVVVYSKMKEEPSRPGIRMAESSAESRGDSPDRRQSKWSDQWHFEVAF